ncbi:MAG: LysR family transcriptional regulator [Alphaproteobacteria bacterium]|nr:MAG: LysR family transcriptional regulator [Alphaproteobacteria bacterium]
MDRLQAVEIFVKVAELKSFSAAATALNLSRTLVSERVRDLEEDLGVRLLQRTTRRVGLTESGAAFLERVRVGLSALEEAAAEASSLSVEPRGLLRVNAALSFGFRHLAPAVGSFLERYPKVKVDLTLDDRQVDLIQEKVDIAIRIGELRDSTAIARKLATCRMLVCAAPLYLKRYGAPKRPPDLKNHTCCSYSLLQDGEDWQFVRGREKITVRIASRLRSNNGDAVAEAAASGAGIALQPDFIAGPLIKQGRLVEVLPGWRAAEYGVFALYPPTQFLPAKSRVFLNHLAEVFAKSPWL